MSKILVVDDEPDILEFIEYNLNKEGYQVFTATNGRDAVEKAKSVQPQLILMDIMMPELDGIEACREIRSVPELNQTLIAFLTARNEDYSQIAGFDAGGDDYINKPIKPRILTKKISAMLRRVLIEDEHSGVYTFDGLTIDKERHLVTRHGEPVQLPKKEFELLSLLASKPGKVFTRGEIFHKVWGSDIIVGDRTIDVHIRKLREKLGAEIISTIKGIGYKFEG